MNPKQNALEIIRFGKPECVTGGPPCQYISYFGSNHEAFDGGGHHLPVGSHWTDIWGTVWHREHEGVMGFPRGNPLADLVPALRTYRWPDPDDERLVKRIGEQAKDWKREETFLNGAHSNTLWEKTYMLVGMENAMCAFYAEPEAMREVLHRVMDFQLGMAEHYAAAGVDMVAFGDDLGTQSGLLLSPEILQEFLVPEYRRLFKFYKSRGVLIGFHSCGHITPILDMFLDLGVDILNPVQASANDLDLVRRTTQGRMALAGGVSSHMIVAGPAEKIRAEVGRKLWQLGRDGGYFCRPDQFMPWPEENYKAFQRSIEELGRYPLHKPE